MSTWTARRAEDQRPFRHDRLCDIPHIRPARTPLKGRRASQKTISQTSSKNLGLPDVTCQKRSIRKIPSCCNHRNYCADRHDRLCGYCFCERAGNAFTRCSNNAGGLESRRDDNSVRASIAAGFQQSRVTPATVCSATVSYLCPMPYPAQSASGTGRLRASRPGQARSASSNDPC